MNSFSKFTLFTAFVALVVVVLGAYTRLSDAGLGCPDWPGCYGHLLVPEHVDDVANANQAFPERPVEAPKAWKEMIHRYFAGSLGLLILVAAIWAWRRRRVDGQLVVLPMFLVALVIFQALLGMWTVTLKVKPVIVMAHLLGGFTTLSLLWWISLRQGRIFVDKLVARASPAGSLAWIPVLMLMVVILQVSLGGWTSANYAALACTDFPTCQTYWWPPMDFKEAFILWRGVGIDYEFGVLDSEARVAIHMSHRIGALVTFLVVGWGASKILAARLAVNINRAAIAVLLILLLQVALGISNIVFHLPLAVAAAHNGVGALLVLSIINLIHLLNSGAKP